MEALILFVDFVTAAFIVWLTNTISLTPFRRAKDLHWAERARRLFPARRGAASNIWVIPAIIAFGQHWLWPQSSPHWLVAALVAWLGAISATWFFDHEVFPWLAWRDWLHEASVAWTLRFLWWFLFFGAIALMPEKPDWRAWLLGGILALAYAVWAWGGLLWTLRPLRLLEPASDRLKGIVQNVSERMRIPVRNIWLLKSSAANAYALPYIRDVVFSERFLKISSDDEVAAVAAHELGHLNEPKLVLMGRLTRAAAILPWVYIRPLYHAWGPPACAVLGLISWITIVAWKTLNRRFEVRADKIAAESEANPGAFAQALAKIHEHNLMPAVLPKKRSTHPDLYDRLLAAGVQPDYPRPEPAKLISYPSFFFAVGFWLLVGIKVALSFEEAQLGREPESSDQFPATVELQTNRSL